MPVKPIPDGYHSVTPYIVVDGASKLIDFLKRAFGAVVVSSMEQPDGTVAHAEVRIGDSMIMLGQANQKWPAMPSALYLYVPDTDATYRQALQAGAKSIMEPADQFYGDRNGGVQDAFGNYWWIGTRVANLSKEELHLRAEAYRAKQAPAV
jgi:PhnB protein